MYRIYDSKLDGYSLSGYSCIEAYERDKKSHVNKQDSRYGDVLVRMKRQHSGFSFRVKLYFRNQWNWKPILSVRFSKYFHWLFFYIWIENEYVDIIDEVVKDHLNNIG